MCAYPILHLAYLSGKTASRIEHEANIFSFASDWGKSGKDRGRKH